MIDNKTTSIISFSLQTVSKETIAKGISPSLIFSILTWMQVNGNEEASNLFLCLKTIYQKKSELRNTSNSLIDVCTIKYYELYDGKMLCLLCQHLLFNCRHHPLLICKCKSGACVDANLEWELVPHDKHFSYWEEDQKRWNWKQLSVKNDEIYTWKNRMDWIDVRSIGISNFGLHRNIFPRDSIRFGIFHMRCVIATQELSSKLLELLSRFWPRVFVDLRSLNKPFTSFQGKDLLVFIINTLQL